jgi:hypothetical protein
VSRLTAFDHGYRVPRLDPMCLVESTERQAVFTIEFVVVRDPGVVERVTSNASHLATVEQTAKGLLEGVRQRYPNRPPDGFQIIDEGGVIVLRSWER